MQGYRTLSSRHIYTSDKFTVREDQVVKPGGFPGVFGVVEVQEGATVLALNDRCEVCLVRESKYAVQRVTLELISGGIEPGEPPLDAAKRELEEEAGLRAREWREFGTCDPFTSMVRSCGHLYLAQGLEPGERNPDPGEELEVQFVPLEQAVEMVMRNEITHAASALLLMKVDRWQRDLRR